MANLCREAALGPIRSIPFEQMEYIRPEQVIVVNYFVLSIFCLQLPTIF